MQVIYIKSNEEKYRQLTTSFEKIFDNSTTAAIIMMKQQGFIADVNKAVNVSYRFCREELQGRYYSQVKRGLVAFFP